MKIIYSIDLQIDIESNFEKSEKSIHKKNKDGNQKISLATLLVISEVPIV